MNINLTKIGNTNLSDHPNSIIQFRVTYPTGKKQLHEEFYESYGLAETKFEHLREEGVDDINLYLALLTDTNYLIDQELIVNYTYHEEE